MSPSNDKSQENDEFPMADISGLDQNGILFTGFNENDFSQLSSAEWNSIFSSNTSSEIERDVLDNINIQESTKPQDDMSPQNLQSSIWYNGANDTGPETYPQALSPSALLPMDQTPVTPFSAPNDMGPATPTWQTPTTIANYGFQAQNRLTSTRSKHGSSLPAQSAETPNPNVSYTDANGQPIMPTYQHYYDTFEDARRAVTTSPDPVNMCMLPLAQDDWQLVKTQYIHHYAAQLFEAIQADPGPPMGENVHEWQRDYHNEHQGYQLTTIKGMLLNRPAYGEARCLLMIQEILNLHEKGLPHKIMFRTSTKSGFLVEKDLICSARIAAVINYAHNDKYVAVDILKGDDGLEDLARSPRRYTRRKWENSRVNAKKAWDKKLIAMGRTPEVKTRKKRGPAAMKFEPASREAWSPSEGRAQKKLRSAATQDLDSQKSKYEDEDADEEEG